MSIRRWLACAAAGALLLTPTAATADEPDGPTVTRHVVESFDGTPIVTNLFLPAGVSESDPAPLVLETHGWGGTGRTAPGGLTGQLVDDGYAVLTWDQRGFGCSGGEVRINDPDVEGRDVGALIDWADDNAPILHRDGDPVVGMIGGSYAGGIQTATAAVDDRLDALVPNMSWIDLRYSLYPGEVVKQGWVSLLYALGTATAEGEGLDPSCDDGPRPDSGLDPAIHAGISEYAATGSVSESTLDFFAKSSIAGYGDDRPVTVPTLVTQSSVDTLFDLTEGIAIHEHVRAQGADSRLLVYCGGHVSCPTTYADADDGAHLDRAIHDWFAAHLRGEERDLGAPFEYRTNEGRWRALEAVPTTDDGALRVEGAAEDLPVVPVLDLTDLESTLAETGSSGGSLQATPLTAASPSDGSDPRAATFEVAGADDGPLELVGVPEVELTVGGTLLESLGELPGDDLEEVLEQLRLDELEPATDEAGEIVGAVPVAGNVVTGLAGGVLGASAADAVMQDVHLFVKLVHREAGEVVNLQEGPVRVGLADGAVTVDVPMSGLAYTIPEGDHLDVQVTTASLMHATGRVPAVVDAALDAAIPVVGAGDEPGGPPHDRPGPPDEPPGAGPERPGGPPDDRPGAGPDDADGGAPGQSMRPAGAVSTPGDAAGLVAGLVLALVAAGALGIRAGTGRPRA